MEHYFSFRKKQIWSFSVLLALGLILAACAPATPSQTQAPVPTATSVAAVPTAPVPVTSGEASLNLANDPKLGSILVGNNGMTVYAFTKDGPNQSNCTGQCAKNWPALKTQGGPQLGSGVDASLVGTATLADGTKVVTYNKMPLYFFYKDSKPGDVNGQGVGSVWFTVSPDGKRVGENSSSGTPSGGTEEPTGAAVTTEATINVINNPKLGNILVDGNGMTLYEFGKDNPDKSNCSAGCLKAWPPMLTQGSPHVGKGVDASLIGSTTLADGSKIVTYNHMPLYRYGADTKPGDLNGQGVGSVWYVVTPDGKPNTQSVSYQPQY